MMRLINGDCLEEMDKLIDEGVKVDAIICDPPYGTTACKWDSVIPFEPMWERLNKLIKKQCPIVLFGSEPFSSALRMSNIKNFKYDWIWNKKLAGNGIAAKYQPLKIHENIHIFSPIPGKVTYIPQKTKGIFRKKMATDLKMPGTYANQGKELIKICKYNDEYYPKSIQDFSLAGYRQHRLHPTQKSTELMEYLIKTYTNEGDTVLDFTMGSGTTGVACKNTNRDFIGIELDKGYFDIAEDRIENVRKKLIQ